MSFSFAMAQKTAQTPKPTKAQLVAELAATLQACSYDGSPVAFSPPDLSKGGSSGKQVVAEIMKYTGLPANFVVVEGQVPNAAAVIMQGPDKVPRRVIAYNPSFMGDVIRATKANNWAPVSIMAHEIGHHLSGHTIVPGGSQPPIELESDKFSGFVLYKMGAPLADAQRAIATLIPAKRGEALAGLFLIAYLGLTLPAVGIGVATLSASATTVMTWFASLLLALLATVAVLARRRPAAH